MNGAEVRRRERLFFDRFGSRRQPTDGQEDEWPADRIASRLITTNCGYLDTNAHSAQPEAERQKIRR